MKKIIFSISAVLLLASCGGQSETDKLCHKWVVRDAFHSSESPEVITEEYRQTVAIWDSTAKAYYINRIYDIKSDGSFSMSAEGESIKGDWKYESNKVQLTVGGKLVEEWTFPENKILIFADSSLQPHMILPGLNIPVDVRLMPAKGEKVEPDTF